MTNVIELLKAAKIASNDFQASHIANGLKLADLHTDEEMIKRAKLYRAWRMVGENTKTAFGQAIQGIIPFPGHEYCKHGNLWGECCNPVDSILAREFPIIKNEPLKEDEIISHKDGLKEAA